ncbi:MAG: hypothetical protein K0R87_1090 [Pseudonocardia sp.]|nr:hypothetical protein [Pseudonocardia sp.]
MVTPSLACAVLALAVVVAPGSGGASRLALLRRSPKPQPRRRTLPTATAAGFGALAGLLTLGPAGALAGAAVATAWTARRQARQSERTAESAVTELAASLGRITEELRAGAHPAAALGGLTADGPLARAAWGPAARAAALGDGVPAALVAHARDQRDVGRDLRRIAAAWELAERHGAPLAELLTAVHTDLRWRVAHAGRVRALLAGPRATATVLTALPVLGILLGELVGADPLAVLRSGVLGQLLVVVGVGLALAGAGWAGHILRRAVPR